jgi:hypothetical protein
MTLLQDVSMTLIREDVSMALLHILIRIGRCHDPVAYLD